jgi:hypothetical protein
VEFKAEEWEHRNCGGQPVMFEPGKWGCTKCKSAWYCGPDFQVYLAKIVFVPRGTKPALSASCKA